MCFLFRLQKCEVRFILSPCSREPLQCMSASMCYLTEAWKFVQNVLDNVLSQRKCSFLSKSCAKTEPTKIWLVWLFFAFLWLYVFSRSFSRFQAVSSFPALAAGCKFSRACWRRLHVVPRLNRVTCFRTLGASHLLSRLLHVYPRLHWAIWLLFSCACHPDMYSCAWHYWLHGLCWVINKSNYWRL